MLLLYEYYLCYCCLIFKYVLTVSIFKKAEATSLYYPSKINSLLISPPTATTIHVSTTTAMMTMATTTFSTAVSKGRRLEGVAVELKGGGEYRLH